MTALPNHPGLEGLPQDRDELRRCVQGCCSTATGRLPTASPARTSASTSRTCARRPRSWPARSRSAEPVRVARTGRPGALHLPALHAAAHRVPAGAGRAGPGAVRVQQLLRPDQVVRPLDHRAVGRGPLGPRRPADGRAPGRAREARLRPLRPTAGKFLTGCEAWIAARAGDVDPDLFGIFDMWGLSFIAGNVLSDIACLNKVELLPWDNWGMGSWGPHDTLPEETVASLDERRRPRIRATSTPSASATRPTTRSVSLPTSPASSTAAPSRSASTLTRSGPLARYGRR